MIDLEFLKILLFKWDHPGWVHRHFLLYGHLSLGLYARSGKGERPSMDADPVESRLTRAEWATTFGPWPFNSDETRFS